MAVLPNYSGVRWGIPDCDRDFAQLNAIAHKTTNQLRRSADAGSLPPPCKGTMAGQGAWVGGQELRVFSDLS